MDRAALLDSIRETVRQKLEKDSSGHDWLHIERVVTNALALGRAEGADLFIVELAALLHDLYDWKFGEEGGEKTRALLEEYGVEKGVIEHVCSIIATLSFKGATKIIPMTTLEGQVVQDADRLDAIGAIGIGRCFAYGGSKGVPIYDPAVRPSFEGYTEKTKGHAKTSSINHFHEKLLLLKDLMNTPTGKAMAEERHAFIELFLEQFYKEVGKG